MGNEGVLKLWDLQTGTVTLQQEKCDSLKIVNKRTKAELIDLEQVIIQSLFIKPNVLLLVTIDHLIVFIKLNKDLVDEIIDKGTKPKPNELFHLHKQLIGAHGEILDAQLLKLNENLLVMSTNNEFVKIYNLDTWDCKLLRGHEDLVICLSVFEGKVKGEDYFASSSKDSTIRVWRVRVDNDGMKSECVAVGIGHTQDVGSLAFSRTGLDFLVSGSIDTTLKLWRITVKETGLDFKCEFTVKAHDKDINSLCVSPNDKLIASASSDKTAKVFHF